MPLNEEAMRGAFGRNHGVGFTVLLHVDGDETIAVRIDEAKVQRRLIADKLYCGSDLNVGSS